MNICKNCIGKHHMAAFNQKLNTTDHKEKETEVVTSYNTC